MRNPACASFFDVARRTHPSLQFYFRFFRCAGGDLTPSRAWVNIDFVEIQFWKRGDYVMKTARSLTILAAGLLCCAALADDKSAGAKKKPAGSAASAGMPMPKPSAEMKEVADLTGRSSTPEKFDLMPSLPAGRA